MATRPPLSRDRIVDAAVAVADRGGMAGVSMRSVGRELGVEAMSLYHHVASKDALLDALADWTFARIELPQPGTPWRPGMAARAESARAVLGAHPWALALVETRGPGDAQLRHHEAVLSCLRDDGLSALLASHAFSAIDAYVYGFALTERNLPFRPGPEADAYVRAMTEDAERRPRVAESMRAMVADGYAFASEFSFGLELILDGIERRLADDVR